jgi:hypothetical protein
MDGVKETRKYAKRTSGKPEAKHATMQRRE